LRRSHEICNRDGAHGPKGKGLKLCLLEAKELMGPRGGSPFDGREKSREPADQQKGGHGSSPAMQKFCRK